MTPTPKSEEPENPLEIDAVEAEFAGLPVSPPLDHRVTACILGIPSDT